MKFDDQAMNPWIDMSAEAEKVFTKSGTRDSFKQAYQKPVFVQLDDIMNNTLSKENPGTELTSCGS